MIPFASFLRRLASLPRDFLLPPRCLVCNRRIESRACLCASCWGGANFLAPPWHPLTGLPLPHQWPGGEEALPPPETKAAYRRARAVMRYGPPVSRKLIARLKYADRPEIAEAAGGWLARCAPDLLAEADLIAPVPLHRRRLFQRRFNQSAELARAAARASRARILVPDLLWRIRPTPSQTGLARPARRRNVARAFAVNPAYLQQVRGRTVLLIDDVMTSGATFNACARALRRAKAAQVDVLALARVFRPREVVP